MLGTDYSFIPILTSEAGSCLTAANWREAGICTASYYLDSLLLKPGQELLKKITDFRKYLGWTGRLVLNGRNCIAKQDGIYKLTSPFDGSKIKLTYVELIDLIQQLKPDAVILPQNIVQNYPEIWSNWDDSIMPFIHEEDLLRIEVQRVHGVSINIMQADHLDNQIDRLLRWSKYPCYIMGDLNHIQMAHLKKLGMRLVESNAPAKDAINGQMYVKDSIIDLTDNLCEMMFEPINNGCACPTCSQQLTKAYLHHLLQQTPLLCQRLLIQHNIYVAQRCIVD